MTEDDEDWLEDFASELDAAIKPETPIDGAVTVSEYLQVGQPDAEEGGTEQQAPVETAEGSAEPSQKEADQEKPQEEGEAAAVA